MKAVIAVSVTNETTGEVIHSARIDERSPDQGTVTVTWDKLGMIHLEVEEKRTRILP